MTPNPPSSPGSIPRYILNGLEKQDAETLQAISRYADQLADYREEQARREPKDASERTADDNPDDWDDEKWDDAIEEAYAKADIPSSKGTLTTKTIDGRDYYYLQWREGDDVKSQYVAPVVPAE